MSRDKIEPMCVDEPGDFILLGRKVIDGGVFIEIDDPEWRARAERFLEETMPLDGVLKALFDRARTPGGHE